MPRFTTPEDAEEHSRANLRELAKEYAPEGKTPKTHTPRGRAFDQICQLAGKVDADLIVIGTRGNTGFKHVLLGSTAERVVRHAPCPVLVVRDTDEKIPEPQILSILVPVDFSECARHGLNYAVALARSVGARLILLHALKLLSNIPWGDRFSLQSVPSVDLVEKAAVDAMNEFVARNRFSEVCPTTQRSSVATPRTEICDFAEQRGVDLIVTSTHGVTGLAHVLIGSVAEHVVRYARCPALVIPQREGLRAEDDR